MKKSVLMFGLIFMLMIFLSLSVVSAFSLDIGSVWNKITGKATALNGYRNAYWQCYDGVESNQGGFPICKSSGDWNIIAQSSCEGHCGGLKNKCGVNSFSVSGTCILGPSEEEKCKDTDGGENIYEAGSVTGLNPFINEIITENDRCTNSGGSVEEALCNEYGPGKKVIECPYGCRDGACVEEIEEVVECIDSDRGLSYYVKGDITGPLASHPDSPREDICTGDSLRELFCNKEGQGEPRLYNCPNGCKDGACISSNYIIKENFKTIIYSENTYEEGPNADMVDFMSTLFPNFINGASTKYYFSEIGINARLPFAIAEFENKISFEDFEKNYLSLINNKDIDFILEYIPANNPKLEGASILKMISYVDADRDGIKERPVVNIVWISHNKFITFELSNENEINFLSLPDFLNAYLEKYPSTLVKPGELIECVDSDDGRDYYVRGKTSGYKDEEYSTGVDVCSVDDIRLKEFYCEGKNLVSEEYSCSNGCSEGVCIEKNIEEVPCIDSDGEDYSVQGVATGNYYQDNEVISYQDFCYDFSSEDPKVGKSNYLKEFVCKNNKVNYVFKECYCENGICVDIEEAEETGTCESPGALTVELRDCLSSVTDELGLTYGDMVSCEADEFARMLEYSECSELELGYVATDCIFEKFPEVRDGFINCGFEYMEEETTITEPEPVERGIECIDSDGGKNIYEKGIVSGIDIKEGEQYEYEYEDYCHGDFDVLENYCKDNHHRGGYHDCPNGCVDGACVEEVYPVEPIVISKTQECGACLLGNVCVPFGYRAEGEYCDITKEFLIQKKADSSCSNHFECKSNVCLEGKCLSWSLIQKVIDWFKKLFGDEEEGACESPGALTVEQRECLMEVIDNAGLHDKAMVCDVDEFQRLPGYTGCSELEMGYMAILCVSDKFPQVREGFDDCGFVIAEIPEEMKDLFKTTCIGSGLDYYTREGIEGTSISGEELEITDYCVSSESKYGGQLYEVYCEGDMPLFEHYDCSQEGKVCEDGICAECIPNCNLEFNVLESEESVIFGRIVSVIFLFGKQVQFNVDGELTTELSEGDTYKLSDGTFLRFNNFVGKNQVIISLNILDKQCGDDGCGGSCGECEIGYDCKEGVCVVPEPSSATSTAGGGGGAIAS